MDRPVTVSLREAQYVARGGSRYVYIHPGDPGLVIKTARWDRKPKRYRLPHWHRQGRLRPTLRQIEEFLTVAARSPQYLHLLERFHGFVETDIGPGLVFEALRDGSGDLAPTLNGLILRGGFDAAARARLAAFLRDVLASDIILDKDFHANNLVYARRGKADAFVLIDSIGDRSPLQLGALHPAIRRWRMKRIIRRFLRVLGDRPGLRPDDIFS